MIQPTWLRLDSPIWCKVVDYLDVKSVFRLSETNSYFGQLLKKRREEIYKEICCRCRIYKLENESWAEAFEQSPQREITAPFGGPGIVDGPNYLFLAFDPFESSSRFAFIAETHVIVTDFDVGKRFYRYFPINYHHAGEDQVCLLMGGKILSVYYNQTQTLQVYEVDSQKLLAQQRFGPGSYQCLGSVMDGNRIFNVITRRFHQLPGEDEYYLHYSCYKNGNQYYLVSARHVFYAFSAEEERLTEVIKFDRATSAFYMMKAHTVVFSDQITTTHHHFPSGKTVHTGLDGQYGPEGFTKLCDFAFIFGVGSYNDHQILYIYNERTEEWVRKCKKFKNIDFCPLLLLPQFYCNGVRKMKIKKESAEEVYKFLYFHCEDGEVMYRVLDEGVDRWEQSFDYFPKLEEEIRTKWMGRRLVDDIYSVQN
uniref:F-box domain-containing protein n=1 Tax=Bursaphelenchus xylophilus TaxID=6326 RepID=A0A1I7S288_BURXY